MREAHRSRLAPGPGPEECGGNGSVAEGHVHLRLVQPLWRAKIGGEEAGDAHHPAIALPVPTASVTERNPSRCTRSSSPRLILLTSPGPS